MPGFLHEQFLQRPLALHRQLLGGVLEHVLAKRPLAQLVFLHEQFLHRPLALLGQQLGGIYEHVLNGILDHVLATDLST